MLAMLNSEGERSRPAEDGADATVAARAVPFQRHGYAPSRENRLFGFAGAFLILGMAVAALLLTLERRFAAPPKSPPLVVTLLPLAAPPKTPPAPKVPPRPVEQPRKPRPIAPAVAPLVRPLVAVSRVPAPAPAPPVEVADPAPAPSPAPSKATPAPPVQPTGKTSDTWEGRLLARLQRFRHYPADAQRNRQQGVVYIHFRMNRAGHVLSSSLERSSGFAALDQAALETLRRADPLPKIPPERPDEVELSVPVEYHTR